jgi:hypothetical protein
MYSIYLSNVKQGINEIGLNFQTLEAEIREERDQHKSDKT